MKFARSRPGRNACSTWRGLRNAVKCLSFGKMNWLVICAACEILAYCPTNKLLYFARSFGRIFALKRVGGEKLDQRLNITS